MRLARTIQSGLPTQRAGVMDCFDENQTVQRDVVDPAP